MTAFDDYEIAPGVRIGLFGELDGVTADDVRALWSRESPMTEEEIERRLPEVFVVGVHDELGLVGVVTRFLAPVEQLRVDLWVLRAMVAESHRMSNVGRGIYHAAVAELDARYVDGTDRRAVGLLTQIENKGLQTRYTDAVTQRAKAVFVGENSRGQPSFVKYFTGAVLP